jgi:predicted nucleic acid-binding protein
LLKLYLDSSIMLKRYITESGTETTDIIFDKAETGELIITVSLWNIGEALGVLDEKRRRGWLTEKEFKATLNNFADELVKLMRLKTLEVTPILTPIVIETWDLVMNYHVYEADALQIITCIHNKNDALISSDEKLIETSRKIGLETFHITKDEQKLRHLI